MEHWATVLDVIEKGIEGDTERCRASAQLLLGKLEASGNQLQALRLRRILAGENKEA